LRLAIDTSAIIAILFEESEAEAFQSAIESNPSIVTGPVLIEALMVLTSRGIENPEAELKNFIEGNNVDVLSFDQPMTVLAQDAFLQFGRGRHPAKLNFGDCMSYALAKSQNVPLLFKGDDFALTDIERAI
jgi:ribonuclease VapC